MTTTKFVTLRVEDKPGQFGKVCRCLANENINIETGGGWRDTVWLKTNDPNRAAECLRNNGFSPQVVDVFEVEAPSRPGTFATIGEELGKVNVNIVGLFGYTAGNTGRAYVWVNDTTKAAPVMDRVGRTIATTTTR